MVLVEEKWDGFIMLLAVVVAVVVTVVIALFWKISLSFSQAGGFSLTMPMSLYLFLTLHLQHLHPRLRQRQQRLFLPLIARMPMPKVPRDFVHVVLVMIVLRLTDGHSDTGVAVERSPRMAAGRSAAAAVCNSE